MLWGKTSRPAPRVSTLVPFIPTECAISGQVFTTCGSACPPTCGEPFPILCTLQCVIGCQCPHGEFLDPIANQCVPECPTGRLYNQ